MSPRTTARHRCVVAVLALASGLSSCAGHEPPRQDGDGHDHSHGGNGHTHDPPRGGGDFDAGGSADGPGDPALTAGAPTGGSSEGEFEWDLPSGFPYPVVPTDNPMSDAKVQLGRRLFYDDRLSGNETFSCASCHEQALAFTDGLKAPVGSTGEVHPRNSMGLANVAYTATLTWANPLFTELERQANVPLFSDSPIELGSTVQLVEARLQADPLYDELFRAAFPAQAEPVTSNNANKALGAFQRTLISGRSAFDRWFYEGDDTAMSESAVRGYELFNGHPFECFHCHAGFNFSDHSHWQGKPMFEAPYHNTGLYNLSPNGAFPEPNTGVHSVTGNDGDMGFFKAPSLRNVEVTAPYMHDGSIQSLDQVIDHYAAGGRTLSEGPYVGVGSQNPHKDPLIGGFQVTARERADLVAFLNSLTDHDFLNNPAFSDPWP